MAVKANYWSLKDIPEMFEERGKYVVAEKVGLCTETILRVRRGDIWGDV